MLAGLTRLAHRLDPAGIMHDLGFTPDAWQADFLRAADDRILMLAARQSGKSTVVGCLGLHTALFTPGSLVLLLSPTQRQSGELYLKIITYYDNLGRPVPPVQMTRTSLDLANGSRVVSLPGSAATIRGFSRPALCVIDEAAQSDDDLYIAVAPMLALGGRLICLSTPFGQRGWFHEQYTAGGGRWRRFTATAEQCPRISPVYLAEQRAILGERYYSQEFMCEFVSTVGQVFSTESILDAFKSDREPMSYGSTL
jgi:hypothetical protein